MNSRNLSHRISAVILTVLMAASIVLIDTDVTFAQQVNINQVQINAVGRPKVPEIKRVTRTSRKVKGERIFFDNGRENLRVYIGEKHEGYSVMQGGCTDGKYAYYLMVSSANQHGRIAKVRMKNNKLVKVSEVLNVWHGNGMAYDSKRKQLVVTSRDEPARGVYRKQEITCIDAKTLQIIRTRQRNVRYNYFKRDKKNFTELHRECGLASIAYCPKYDVYIADQRVYHNLIVINPDNFKVMGLVRTKILKKYPGIFQGMDADDQYAYMLLSPDEEGRQNRNVILALDWNSSVLRDKHGRRRKYVKEKWRCLNNGKPVAVYKLNLKNEAENIFHTTSKKGRTHFYVSEYHYDTYYTGYTLRKETPNGYDYVEKVISPRHCRLDYVYDLGVL